jgi:hypothetical protein
MNNYNKIALILTVLLFSTTAMAQNTTTKDKLAMLFTHDMIGVTIAYVETQLGPAKRVSDYTNEDGDYKREYQVGPCTVNIEGKESISSIELVGITEECSFDITQLLLEDGYKEAYKTTFGFLANNNPFEFYSGCINICHVPQDPHIIFEYNIAGVVRFFKLTASISVFDESLGNELHELGQFINDDELNWIDDQQYAPKALELFKNVYIKKIKFE